MVPLEGNARGTSQKRCRRAVGFPEGILSAVFDSRAGRWQNRPEVTECSESTHKRTKHERGLYKHVSENASDNGLKIRDEDYSCPH
jgi:hypothetical protein